VVAVLLFGAGMLFGLRSGWWRRCGLDCRGSALEDAAVEARYSFYPARIARLWRDSHYF
jgi:hypothetical protein